MAIAGVMGGLRLSEVASDTTAILLESATFDAIRAPYGARGPWACAPRPVALREEPRSRAGHARPPALRGALPSEHCPGCRGSPASSADVYPGVGADPSSWISPTPIVRRRLGLRIPDMRTRAHLGALGFPYEGDADRGPRRDRALVARERRRQARPEDLVEEIGRIEGYSQDRARSRPVGPLEPLRDRVRARSLERRVGSMLSLDLGYAEVKHRSFYGADDRGAHRPRRDTAHLDGAQSDVPRRARPDDPHATAGNLLATIAANRHRATAGRIWESARIVNPRTEGLPDERAGRSASLGWNRRDEDTQCRRALPLAGRTTCVACARGSGHPRRAGRPTVPSAAPAPDSPCPSGTTRGACRALRHVR